MDRFMKFIAILLVVFAYSCAGAYIVKKRNEQATEDFLLERLEYPEENIGVDDADLIEGDIKFSRRRNAIGDHNKLWSTRIIPYEVAAFTPSDATQIQVAIEQIEKSTCVRFKLRHNEPDYIIFQKRDSCNSDVGRTGGPQTINLADSCIGAGYIIHEIMHSLGFWHEHTRPDRDDYVRVIWNNIEQGMDVNFEKKDPNEVTFPGAYDYGSIMHYTSNNFAKDRSKPTLVPLQRTDAWMGQRNGLSPLDVWKINTVYKCKNTACPHPGTPAHGILLATDLSVGRNVSYRCKPGYALIGGATRFCQDIEEWTGSIPECLSGVLHYCNFDHPDLCGWTQSRLDEVNWTWNSGRTKTKGTGPPSDHTYSYSSLGHYLYLESSSPFKTGDRARIASPSFVAPSVPVCLRYFYSMFGKGMGTLNIYTKQKGIPRLVRTLTGNHGEGWKEDKFALPVRQKESFQIIFEGIRGVNWTSDIAFDDVVVGDCSSTSGTPVSLLRNGPGTKLVDSCNFNNGLCGFTQMTTDDFDWTIRSGGTTTDRTICDHDDCQHGRYLHIDTSKHAGGTVARILSPTYRSINSGAKCISFYYLIQGDDLGGLALYLGGKTPVKFYEIWSKVTESTNLWEQAMVEIRPSAKFMLMFEGIIRKGVRGDLAIDDVVIIDGPCPYKAAMSPKYTTRLDELTCDFDQDMCGWSNPLATRNVWRRNRGPTSTPNTGPPYDHTSRKGYYLYAEALNRVPGTAYVLLSHNIPTNPDGYCLHIWYYMFGNNIGTLKVVMDVPGAEGVVLWEKVGDQGREWKRGSVFIPGVNYQYKLAIVGVIRGGKQGDIAIDDVSIHPGPCQVVSTSVSYRPTPTRNQSKNRISVRNSTRYENRLSRRRDKIKKKNRRQSRKRKASYNQKVQSFLRTQW